MCEACQADGIESLARTLPGYLDLNPWTPNEVVITDTSTAYIIEPGMPVRDHPCVICEKPLAGVPAVLHFMTAPKTCSAGTPHLQSVAVARHLSCPRPCNEAFYDLIMERVADCFG